MSGKMKLLLCVMVCCCLLQNSFADIEGIIDKVKSGAKKVKQSVHCGFHKAKNVLVEHEHGPGMDPCHPGEGNEQPGVTHLVTESEEYTTIGKVHDRRLVNVAGNCEPGFKRDADGICREDY